jgi:hypothetical protein
MNRWNLVGDRSHDVFSVLGNFLLINDAFRISIDNSIARMNEIRDELVSLDLRQSAARKTYNKSLLADVAHIDSDLDVIERRVHRLANMSHCLAYSSRPSVGQQQIDQLDSMCSEVIAMRQVCSDYVDSAEGNLSIQSRTSQSCVHDEDQFGLFQPFSHHRIIPETSTWAGFHLMLGGQPTLSDKHCSNDETAATTASLITEQEPAADNLPTHTNRSLLSRVFRAAIPIHLLTLTLLGLSVFVPVCQVPDNNFLYSVYPLLRYTDGLPPL